MKKIYNKLVRDKIPEIIKAGGGEPETRILDSQEFAAELLKKLLEETQELIEAKEDKRELIKEAGDVYEALEAIIQAFGLDRGEILKLKEERKKARGGFNKKTFLISVNE